MFFFSSSSTLITVATSQCDVARLVPAGVFVLSFTFVCLSVCLVSHSFYSSVCQTDSQSIGERGNEKRIINLYIRSNIVNGSQLIQHNFFYHIRYNVIIVYIRVQKTKSVSFVYTRSNVVGISHKRQKPVQCFSFT